MSRESAGGWRHNVAAVVVDAAGNVLLGSNPEESRHHHFPQGGVERGESFSAAVMRELWEETGLEADACRIVARFGGLRYRYRADNPKSGRWKGQEQCYFLISCPEVRPFVAAKRGHEFTDFVWLPRQQLEADLFPPVKRKVIRSVLEVFFPVGGAWSPAAVAARLSPARYLLQATVPPLRLHDPADRALFGGGKDEAVAEWEDLSAEFSRLQTERRGDKRRVLLLFGMEGCGMRNCLRRLAAALDPLSTRIGSPLIDRPAPDFLWPLHAALPCAGETLLLPRSPYDDLLALPPSLMARRAAHLADFETMLAEEGIQLLKVYLHVSENKFVEKKTEGMSEPERAAALQNWRERAARAAGLLTLTQHTAAPWYIVPSDHRRYRDLVLLRLLLERYAEAD